MRTPLALACLTLTLTTGCEDADMTNAEVLEALGEYADSARGEAAANEPIEISTEFTIGDAVEAAAQQVADFWASQQPCTTVTHSGATVTIDYGGLDDACEFEGSTYGGIAEITVDSATPGQLQVTHDWFGLMNDDVTLDGGAVVLWTGDDQTRTVQTTHTWTGHDDGKTVDVEGEHTFGPLDDAGWLGGVTLEGQRLWISDTGEWTVDMHDLELRWIDPVAQAGTVTLTNPDGKTLDIVHERLDEQTIRVTLTGARKDWVFDINALGIPSEVTE